MVKVGATGKLLNIFGEKVSLEIQQKKILKNMGKFRHSRQVKICCFTIELNLLLLCQVKDLRMCSLYCSFMYTNQMCSVQYMYVLTLHICTWTKCVQWTVHSCTRPNCSVQYIYVHELIVQFIVHLCTQTNCAMYFTCIYSN